MLEKESIAIWDNRHSLANFASIPVQIRSGELAKLFPTCEHLYQAAKFFPADSEIREEIRLADNPTKAREIVKSNKNSVRPDWEDIEDHVMVGLIRLKLRQNPQLQQELVNTGKKFIYEDADKYAPSNPTDIEILRLRKWGIYQGEGQNMIGEILMGLREELKLNGKV